MAAELRRRKLKDQNVGPKSKRPSKNKDVSGIQRSLICLIISGATLIFFFGLYVDSWDVGRKAADSIAKSFGYHEPVYAIVIDAGSTGSRILAFSFHKAYLDGRLVLDRELFVETKPGLSSFAKNPEKGAHSIELLLEKAKEEIPKMYWGETALVLKATAGLRLLPAEQAAGLLDAVRKMFEESPFHTTKTSVSIMDGVDEGIYSWFTVNFLLEKLTGNPDRTVAALDLGGGSTQVTFAPTTPATLKQTEYIHSVHAIKGTIPVYTHSYLGLGLMAARKEILSNRIDDNILNLTSVCINPFISGKKWMYGGIEYTVGGQPNNLLTKDKEPRVDFDECERIITDYVYTKVIPLHELDSKQINAFSYYFDRATETGLIDPYKGGQITVAQFLSTAKTECSIANVDQPFMCLDLTYIWILLEKGFGLSQDTKLNLFKKINGHEVSWALGAAFNELVKEN